MPYYGSQGQEIEDGEWDNMRRDERERKQAMETKWVYVRSEPRLWTVGFYDASCEWHTDSDHETQNEAADRVAFLNGAMVEDVPAEPTITLTQAQVVALWQRYDMVKTVQARAVWYSDKSFENYHLITAAMEQDAKEFLGLLGAPASWASVLVEAVTK